MWDNNLTGLQFAIDFLSLFVNIGAMTVFPSLLAHCFCCQHGVVEHLVFLWVWLQLHLVLGLCCCSSPGCSTLRMVLASLPTLHSWHRFSQYSMHLPWILSLLVVMFHLALWVLLIRALHLTLLLVALREKRSSSTLPCLCDCHGGGSFVIFTTNFKIKIEQLNNVWKSPAVPSENLSSRHIASFFRFGGLESVLFCELCAPPTMKWYAGILCAAFWVSQRTFRR